MLFNSLAYAAFLPIVFCLYWAIPHKYRCILLLVASYYFYMSWNVKYVVLIITTTLTSYVASILIEKQSSIRLKKVILFISLLVSLGILFFFKYFDFFLSNITVAMNCFGIQLNPITLKVLLPVGISFYTFQTIGYVIDVYRGDVKAERNLCVYATFISFFPQLVAGPIERTRKLLPQIRNEKVFDYSLAIYGTRQILWGLFKKVAIADVAAVYVDNAYKNLEICSGLNLCAAIFLFTIQIYCDFSGYSDIAIGSAKLLGINLTKNFSSPYFSLSIKEFWSRWHISLSTWFKDYLYIPLGGNRCSKARTYYNLILTFIMSGLWHGANWTFVLWGALHGFAQVIEKMFGLENKKRGKITSFFSWLVVFAFCNIAWVFFRADDFNSAIYVINHVFCDVIDLRSYIQTVVPFGGLIVKIEIVLAILVLTIFDYKSLKIDVIDWINDKPLVMRITLEYILLVFIFVSLYYATGETQFVYFQF